MFRDRDHAAMLLADAVEAAAPEAPVVLALPRGGVPVAAPVAERLGAPLDLLMVRKLGMPGQPELAGGAVVDGPAHEVVFNSGLLASFGLTEEDFKPAIEEQLAEIERRRRVYLGDHAPVDVTGRTAIVIDDGIATGATVKAALKALRKRAPAAIWLAVPVAPADTLPEFEALVDRLICLETPSPFWAVGAHYSRFDQVSDAAVAAAMRAAWGEDTDKTE
ncbi:phosphoribosyltransferase family protein [Actibacterium sp. MT2.3-13A]|uniref:phosphoribosyltransferase n=1 Tax=Actibacterium sp. MT2.3-13A TaxID=2828332 RepID=UPI001BAB18CC|nr:phosphoribosyltransferase family protein [Actibacterium sp. MT2.3-13A]